MTIQGLPQLPLTCLKTADSKSTDELVKGNKTTVIGTSRLHIHTHCPSSLSHHRKKFSFVQCLNYHSCTTSLILTHEFSFLFIVDFWTTRCTRCPDALDKLDELAQDPRYEDVNFVSICCDKLDGARTILEQEEEVRWQNIDHYFMDKEHKEQAKKILGFRQVPFYLVVDEDGEIRQKGGSKDVDFEEIPSISRPSSPSKVIAPRMMPTTPHKMEVPRPPLFEEEKKEVEVEDLSNMFDQEFIIDDMDF